jgi:putative heme iron utilization protein
MSRKEQAAADARQLLLEYTDGVLCTLSDDPEGCPFGSVVPYCLDRAGNPVMYISDIAEHTRNVQRHPLASLLVFDRRSDDLQKHARLTLMGRVEELGAGEADLHVRERYFRIFPEARGYENTHDFAFFRLVPQRLRYIGGFGKIHWFRPAEVLPANPFDARQELGIVAHVNADHADILPRYLARVLRDWQPPEPPSLVAVDALGMHLRTGDRVVRVPFPAPAEDMTSVRERFVELAKSAA